MYISCLCTQPKPQVPKSEVPCHSKYSPGWKKVVAVSGHAIDAVVLRDARVPRARLGSTAAKAETNDRGGSTVLSGRITARIVLRTQRGAKAVFS